MTDEELDRARVDEAIRTGNGIVGSVALIAARLAREGWTPPEPVDPDRLEAYNLAVFFGEEFGNYTPARLALKAIKRGRALVADETKPGMVWVKHDGSIKCPVVDKNAWVWVRVKGCHDPYISPPQTLHWPVITHYAIITQPENAA